MVWPQSKTWTKPPRQAWRYGLGYHHHNETSHEVVVGSKLKCASDIYIGKLSVTKRKKSVGVPCHVMCLTHHEIPIFVLRQGHHHLIELIDALPMPGT